MNAVIQCLSASVGTGLIEFIILGVYWIHLVRPSVHLSMDDTVSRVCCLWLWAEAYWFSAMSLSKLLPGSHIGFFGLRTLTLIWLWISSPNFTGTSHVCMGKCLLIFSNVAFKMPAWWPYWVFHFQDSNFSLALNSKPKLQVKSNQVNKFYCNKIINIHGIIQRLKPIGFICLIQSWPQLHCNDLIVVTTGLVWVQALRRNGRGSSATATSSCTKGYHAENLQCNQQRQRRHYYDPSAPVNKNDAKHHIVKIP